MARTEKEMRAKITADDRDFKKKTEGAKKQGKSFGQTMAGVAKLIGAAFVLKKAYDGIKRLIGGMMEMADRLLDLSDMTGMTTDALQEWQYVSKIAGVNTEAVSNAAQNLTNRFQNLYREQSPISRGFREMGIEAFNASGELRNTGDIVDDVITTLAEMENATERNAYGAQLFGGSWKDLAPILAMGAEGIEKVKQEARDMGVVMDREAIEKANELRQAKVRLSEATGALWRELGSKLVPVLTTLAEGMTSLIQQTRGARQAFEDLSEAGGWGGWDKIKNVFYMLTGNNKALARSIGEVVKESEDHLNEINNTRKAQKELAEQTKVVVKQFDHQTATIGELNEEIKRLQEQKEGLSAADKDEIDNINRLIELYSQAKDELTGYRKEIQGILPPAEEFSHIIEQTDEQILEFLGDIQLVTEEFERMPGAIIKIIDHLKLATETAKIFGQQVMWASVTGEQGLKEYGRTVANTARENIKAYMAEAIAATIRAHIGLGPFGLALAGIAAGAAAALFNQVVPAFAAGGAVSGPTLALVGEGPGVSRSNPEYIGTAKQLGQMGMEGKVRFEIEGDRLVGILDRQRRKNIYFG